MVYQIWMLEWKKSVFEMNLISKLSQRMGMYRESEGKKKSENICKMY